MDIYNNQGEPVVDAIQIEAELFAKKQRNQTAGSDMVRAFQEFDKACKAMSSEAAKLIDINNAEFELNRLNLIKFINENSVDGGISSHMLLDFLGGAK